MNSLPPIREDRIIHELPLYFTREAAVHTKTDFHVTVQNACQRADSLRFTVAKVIIVGDVAVGKTSLINRFCRDTYEKGYKATIGVDFEMERFEILGVPFSLQLQWLEDAMIDNDPSSVLLFLVGTKKDLSHPDVLAQMEQEAIKLSEEIRAEYWAVSALSGESVREFFLRVASLTFEARVLAELERNNNKQLDGIVKITDHDETSKKKHANCCS
ncbi:ras-related protein Rab-34 isoform X2 [Pangasianodon hypophthalmus]|uniref:ras-related protein Rab-34 isoform X2 n=1 Tax=Pangasianodon hypophthalmus TaxID=310915 RepID=UPI002307B2BE|nr:ras-related protein Rab-34 isoform X2 [Pangasianodon hypophthalmus]